MAVSHIFPPQRAVQLINIPAFMHSEHAGTRHSHVEQHVLIKCVSSP